MCGRLELNITLSLSEQFSYGGYPRVTDANIMRQVTGDTESLSSFK